MPAFNFKAQFADLVASGTKRRTIRALRKDGRLPQIGQMAYLYTGMRTRHCRALGVHVILDVAMVELRLVGDQRCIVIDRNRVQLSVDDAELFAAADGFESVAAMFDFFERTHGLPFTGVLARW